MWSVNVALDVSIVTICFNNILLLRLEQIVAMEGGHMA